MADMTRREWNALVLGGLAAWPASRLGAFAPSPAPGPTIAGVRVGTQSYSFRDKTLDEMIAAMQDIGLGSCELWSGHVEPPAVPGSKAEERREAQRTWRLTVPLDEFRAIRKKFDAAGITLTAYNYSFRDDFTDAEMARGFEMAKALGVGVITASSNVTTSARVDPFARKSRIKVGFHNHAEEKPNEFAGPEDFEEAMKGKSEFIAINLDIGHFVAAGHDPLPFLEKYHSRIVSLHLKDRKKGDLVSNVPFGDGDTPIAAVLRTLRDRRWPIPANIEYEYKGSDTVAEVRRCFEYCKQALNSGRKAE